MATWALVLAAALPGSAAAALPRSAATPHVVLRFRGGGPTAIVPTKDAAQVLSSKEAYMAMAKKGEVASKMTTPKVLFASIMGGCYVGIGGLLSMSIAGNLPGLAKENPGAIKFIFAALFPVNLLLVLQTGSQLFTGNTATMSMALCESMVTFKELLRSWGLSFSGNVVGCGLLALAAKYTGLLSGGTAELAIKTVNAKCALAFGPTFVKAILCNWLVCLAVFLATSASDMTGKMVGIWFPISTFVAIGLEHSVANLFLLPLGLLAGAPVSSRTALLKNLLPVTLGNIVSGALIVGAGLSFAHGRLGDLFDGPPPPPPSIAGGVEASATPDEQPAAA